MRVAISRSTRRSPSLVVRTRFTRRSTGSSARSTMPRFTSGSTARLAAGKEMPSRSETSFTDSSAGSCATQHQRLELGEGQLELGDLAQEVGVAAGPGEAEEARAADGPERGARAPRQIACVREMIARTQVLQACRGILCAIGHAAGRRRWVRCQDGRHRAIATSEGVSNASRAEQCSRAFRAAGLHARGCGDGQQDGVPGGAGVAGCRGRNGGQGRSCRPDRAGAPERGGALESVGASFDDIAKITLYIVDWEPSKLQAIGAGAEPPRASWASVP